MKFIIILLLLIINIYTIKNKKSVKNVKLKYLLYKKTINYIKKKNKSLKNKIFLEMFEVICYNFKYNYFNKREELLVDDFLKDFIKENNSLFLNIINRNKINLFKYKCKDFIIKYSKNNVFNLNNSNTKLTLYSSCNDKSLLTTLDTLNKNITTDNNKYSFNKYFCFNKLEEHNNQLIVKGEVYKVFLDGNLDKIIISDLNNNFLCEVNNISDLKNEKIRKNKIIFLKDNNNIINCYEHNHSILTNNIVIGNLNILSLNLLNIFKS